MAGEVGSFVVGTDVVGGASSSGVAGGALPGTWSMISAEKPEQIAVGRSGPTSTQVDS